MEAIIKPKIIIGAGIAGLIAAKRLSSQFDCMILEASDHIGGRILYTRKSATRRELCGDGRI